MLTRSWAASHTADMNSSRSANRTDAEAKDAAKRARDSLTVGRDVLVAEAGALSALAGALDTRFAEAVDLVAEVTGRVVVTGMGKSGHVARKIAATFASTGTPSMFVHPAEASHGDLGMIVPGDAVIALSNSGEATELADIVAHTSRFDLPLVAITSRAESTLARAADIILVLPPVPEAGPIGLAPTTSTTMQMALGDALAIALLARRGFTPAEFGIFHPGGNLGGRLKRVGQLMHTGPAVPLASPDLTMDRAIVKITEKHFGCLGVVDASGRLIGVVTDGDLRRAMGPDILTLTVQEVMTRAPRVIGPNALAEQALHDMTGIEPKIMSLFVLGDDRRVLGIIHMHDLLRAGIA